MGWVGWRGEGLGGWWWWEMGGGMGEGIGGVVIGGDDGR